MKPEYLYLELLKKTLAFTLWPEPLVAVPHHHYKKTIKQKLFFGLIVKMANRYGIQLAKQMEASEEMRTDGLFWPSFAHTMIGMKRLDNLQQCTEQIIQDDIKGDLIETGVWRGGSCIFMRAILKAFHIEDRKVYVADSFQGLPKPDEEKYPADKDDTLHEAECLAVSQEEVQKNFMNYGLMDDQVVFLKGWFEDTLPSAPIEKLSILRLDGDMYSSTITALESLYPKLSAGGFCIIDDYALSNCKQAVDDYRERNGINCEFFKIDWSGHYWRKT